MAESKSSLPGIEWVERAFGEIDEVVLVVNPPDRRIVACNDAVERVLGYTCDELVGSSTESLHVDREASEQWARLTEPVLEREGFFRGEYSLRRKDGERIATEHTIVPLHSEAGWLAGVLSIIRDVSRRRRLEVEHGALQEQVRLLQRMEAIGRFAGGIAHEFNNLLTSILGYANLVHHGLPADDPLRRDIDEIRIAAERGASLTGRLLAFSGRQLATFRHLDLRREVEDTERLLRRIIGEDVELSVLSGPDIPPVQADPDQIRQVLLNLAVNAREAMPRGGQLTIRLRAVDLDEGAVLPSGRYASLQVRDTGVGIEPELQSHVFEPFFTTRENAQSGGLGLSTVAGIVRRHGGHIDVDSTPGGGTVFEILLPAADEEATEAADLRLLESEGEAAAAPTVLLVEDDDALRRLTGRVLERYGCRVLSAARPGQALLMAEEHRDALDLVVTDVVMPQLTGPQVVERLRARDPSLPVVYMSGYADPGVREEVEADARTFFLAKPFSPARLGERVRDALRSRAWLSP